jgi:Uma2 family endonuclease
MTYPDTAVQSSFVYDDGVNAPIRHQQIIARLTVELGILYHKQHSIPYEPLPETMLAEGYGNPVPDLILFDHEAEQTRVIIEVCQTTGQNNDLDKVIRLVEQANYGILEGFVYNYKTGQWLRYCKGDGGKGTESSFSKVLNLDLGPFVV